MNTAPSPPDQQDTMKNLVLSLILTAAITHAQNTPPPTPPVPPTPAPAEPAPPAVPPPTPATPATPPATGKVEKPKPLSPGDQKFAKRTSEVVLFQLALATRAKSAVKEDKELSDWGAKKAKELTEKWTPFATICGKYGFSDIPVEITKKESADIAKLSKSKDEKFRQDYLELFMKESKSALRDMENAPKMVQNAELKAWAEGFVGILKANAPEIETKYKEEKKRK